MFTTFLLKTGEEGILKEYRLIAVDMDGTLLNSDLEISPRTAASIRKAREKGVKVTLCTGRMFASASQYADKLELNVPLITYNGALVKNSHTREVLYERDVPLEEAVIVVNKCRKLGFQLNMYVDDRLYVENDNDDARGYAERVNVPLNVVDDFIAFLEKRGAGPIKMLAMGEEKELDSLRDELYSQGSELYITRSRYHFLEFLNKEANKGAGLKAVADSLGIPKDAIMAIGDNENDLAMFKYARTAIVMKNARDDIKASADYVTEGTNDEDGVASILEKLVLGK